VHPSFLSKGHWCCASVVGYNIARIFSRLQELVNAARFPNSEAFMAWWIVE